MGEHASTFITLASFLLMSAGVLVTVTWKLSNAINELKEAIAAARDEVEQRQDVYVRQVGETIAGLRQKIVDVELDTAKHYMRSESFYAVKAEMASEIKELGRELGRRLDRMEEKMIERAAG